ncbi:MAG: hypothetical protein L0H55_07945 [Candidatus Nitrosocosmicus sp.]|nr:hypothetical protein [Candidatus Nitrosocosmicus sp.]
MTLLDRLMSNLNGLELAERMRKHNSQLRIRFIPAFFIQDFMGRHDFIKANLADMMIKPIRSEDLEIQIVQLHSRNDDIDS